MGGTKRKIKIEEIEKKTVKSVAFTKRRNGLFRKAAELCLLSASTQIAILATPPSTNSHAAFYSFGHSSVDHVVSSLLNDRCPIPTEHENTSGLGFWWDYEGFDTSENIDDLKEATDAVSRMLNKLRLRLEDLKSNQRDGGIVIHQEEVLQICDIERNNNEEMTNQITRFEGASGSGSLVENLEDNLPHDELFSDAKIDPF
ncbi:unnamed protein product [Eruca vesicaria subsp. sativa]|uniref:MADS-box domain-containing protein n=1 Tax=Eruca vesicaria subsp. sativa TaxID=29727 RepID=A0ABC8LET5_ERUVS|nr:unnamed protein product [Eruca vesicaria subsp. sativa]